MSKCQIKFYPVGNGDTTLITTETKDNILIDFNYIKERKEFDLLHNFKKDIGDKKSINVMIITHMDKDHVGGFAECFNLLHAQKYQSDERIHINELWVPAAVILEQEDQKKPFTEDQKILRAEARYRIRNKKGIKIFSLPEDLKDWCEAEGIDINNIDELFVRANDVLKTNFADIEIYCHSPFYDDTDENNIDRNTSSIILHFTFNPKTNNSTKFFAFGDTEYQNIERIVRKSRGINNDRLQWDILSVPHHCSYKALSDDKGKKETIPTEKVKYLLERGNTRLFYYIFF